mmetsp:Transcript_8884/g.11098  ORF Transcript_8884/g.11098 Transcript_8884/m.11098 type:complete len:81 (-) Transcript_8884:35-277(-)
MASSSIFQLESKSSNVACLKEKSIVLLKLNEELIESFVELIYLDTRTSIIIVFHLPKAVKNRVNQCNQDINTKGKSRYNN